MSAFLGISSWFAFVTVVPGLVTLASIFGAFAFVSPSFLDSNSINIKYGGWILGSIAITIMLLTQAAGIQLEKFLVKRKGFVGKSKKFILLEGIDPLKQTELEIAPKAEYQNLYFLLAGLKKEEDTQGHLERIAAQFFLTNNTIVSFIVGISTTCIIVSFNLDIEMLIRGGIYIALLVACLLLNYKVAKGRFLSLAKAICIIRRERIAQMSLSEHNS